MLQRENKSLLAKIEAMQADADRVAQLEIALAQAQKQQLQSPQVHSILHVCTSHSSRYC